MKNKNLYIAIPLIVLLVYIIKKVYTEGDFSFLSVVDDILNKDSKYKQELAKTESGNNYRATNSAGALGKYQFMPTTLTTLQYRYNLPPWLNVENFLSNGNLQEKYIDALILDSVKFINRNGLSKHYGKIVTGSMNPAMKNISAPITKYGLLGAIHLSGGGNVLNFFSTGYNPNDGHTSLSDYMAYFSKNV
jgi:hypothetical protein